MASELGLPGLRRPPTADRRQLLSRRIQLFVTATITYNVIEAVIALTEGTPGLLDGADRFWPRLGDRGVVGRGGGLAVRRQRPRSTREDRAAHHRVLVLRPGPLRHYRRDPITVRFREAQHSIVGIALAAVSLVIMPVLSWAQRRAGRELGSLSAVADSKQTLLCTYLSAVLLVGLLLNSLFGWSWAPTRSRPW